MAKEFEEKVLEAIGDLRTEICSEIGGLRGEINTGIGSLRSEIGEMKSDIRRLEILHEETDSKIDAIIEGMSPTIEKVVDHEIRITRLEAA